MKTKIIFEDADIMVVYKPAGIATQASGFRQVDVVSELKNYLVIKRPADQKGEPYLGIIHRLDQPVEGILVFAKNEKAAAGLSKQVTEQSLKKEYLAAVYPEKKLSERACLTDYLVKDAKTNTSKVSTQDDKSAKKAVLNYHMEAMQDEIGYVRIALQTGRHHQIRVQLSHAGMPLLGDQKYGSEASKAYSENHGIKDVALCACKLAFKHPKTGKQLVYSIEPKKEILQKYKSVSV